MKEILPKDTQQKIAWEITCFMSWLQDTHNIVIWASTKKVENITNKFLKAFKLEHSKKDAFLISVYALAGLQNDAMIAKLRAEHFDVQADAFMKKIKVTINSLKSSPKKPKKKKTKPKPKVKSKKSDLKKDLKWFDAKGSFEKVKRGELVGYEDGYKPRAQYKSTKKFPLTGCWIFVEKNRENNKWKAYLRKMKKKYWEDVEYSRYCKDEDSAWVSLYKKIMNS